MEGPCRICLGCSPYKNLFSSTISHDEANVANVTCQYVMTKIFSLTVNPDDGLPATVCNQCYSALSGAYKLKTLADRSYLLLLDSVPIKDEKTAQCTDAIHLAYPHVEVKIEEQATDDVESLNEDVENIPLINYVKESQKSESTKKLSKSTGKSHSQAMLRKIKYSQDKVFKVKPKICELCGKQVRHLQDHMRKHSQSKKEIQCKFCPKLFSTYGGRNRHQTTEHLGLLYFCEICKKHYKNGFEHNRTQHTELPKLFECVSCHIKCRTLTGLKYHMTVHTKEKPFSCTLCGKAFRSKSFCDYHRRRVHEGEKKFVCQYCSKGFFSKGHLNDHIKIHTKEKDFKCEECGKLFTKRQTLKIHRERHKGIKNEKCSLCEKTFVTKGALRTHMISHTKEKKYECKYCGVKFGRSDHKNRHERTAHHSLVQIKEFQC